MSTFVHTSADTSLAPRLACLGCEAGASWGTLGRCAVCGGILAPVYAPADRSIWAPSRPGHGLDRYRAQLPAESAIPYLGEGDTPLVASRAIGPKLGIDLYFKIEGSNPSGSFKDRPGALAAALARESGRRGILTASSGNAGSAIAAYAAAAKLPCLILLEPGNPPAKLRQIVAAGAEVVPVEGIFRAHPDVVAERLLAVAARLAYYLAFVWAPVNPYLLEAIKTVSYEIGAQLPGPPDVMVCPVGGGDMLTAVWRGFRELQVAGVTSAMPRMIGVQSASAAPLVQAFEAKLERVAVLERADSKISGINVPFSGDHALAALRESSGAAVAVEDETIFAAQREIAVREGLFVEPASAAPVAALARLLQDGTLRPGERVVCLLSGSGLKDAQLGEAEARKVAALSPVVFETEAIVSRVGNRSRGQV